MQIYRISTTPSPSSIGVSWQLTEEFHSNPDSDIELADEEREDLTETKYSPSLEIAVFQTLKMIMMSQVLRITLSARITLSKIQEA